MQEEDRTIIMFPSGKEGEPVDDKTRFVRNGLRVTLLKGGEQFGNSRFFPEGFRAGRSKENDLLIPFNIVSRRHLEVKRQADGWWVYDSGSANGVYLDGQRIDQGTRLALPAMLQLGDSACFLQLEEAFQQLPSATEAQPEPLPDETESGLQATHPTVSHTDNLSREQLRQRLLAETEAEDAGDYTRMVRELIHEDRSTRRKRYRKIIWGTAVLLLLAVGLLVYQQLALNKARTLALDMFYDIKTLELNLSQAEIRLDEHMATLQSAIEETRNEKLIAEQKKLEEERIRLVRERERLSSMRVKYQQYVQEANALKLRFPGKSAYEEQLILKVARQFGESELEAPPGFVNEVKRYIGYWQGSSRFPAAMQRLEANGYAPIILSALQKQNLPPDFIYLPLQESNYNPQAIGPETRYGIAKGAWQFLASTGQEYGLQTGPKAGVREYDPLDQRFDFNRATSAGARYLKYIYSTEAQVSGLLVMASYNYGHNRVRSLIVKMPENPRDRNFWKFIQHYQIPQETYDYVFYIVAAAVIGEDPAHFGFRFKPPLSGNVKQTG